MRTSILFLLINLLFISCTQKKLNPKDMSGVTVCGKSDPLNELQWLKEKVEKQTTPPKVGGPFIFSIVVYEYENKVVIADESPFHSSPYLHIFNCDGSATLKVGEYEKFVRENRKIKVLLEFDGKKVK